MKRLDITPKQLLIKPELELKYNNINYIEFVF